MNRTWKFVLIATILLIASLTSLYAIDVSGLKYENGILSFNGSKLQYVNVYAQGGGLFTKASDITAMSILTEVLIITTKERVLNIELSKTSVMIYSIKDQAISFYM